MSKTKKLHKYDNNNSHCSVDSNIFGWLMTTATAIAIAKAMVVVMVAAAAAAVIDTTMAFYFHSFIMMIHAISEDILWVISTVVVSHLYCAAMPIKFKHLNMKCSNLSHSPESLYLCIIGICSSSFYYYKKANKTICYFIFILVWFWFDSIRYYA